jgi:type II secretory ATPase GspE/PulE/Tfp pilus assembly ATPase PilB-like protein
MKRVFLGAVFFTGMARNGWAAGQLANVSLEAGSGLYVNPFWFVILAIAAIGWLYVTWWISDDAQGNSLDFKLWAGLLLGIGWLCVLLMFFLHPAFVFLLVISLAVVWFAYVKIRNKHVPIQYQLLQRWLGTEEAKLQVESASEDGESMGKRVDLKNRTGRKMGDIVARNPNLAPCLDVLGEILATACAQEVDKVFILPSSDGYAVQYEQEGFKHGVDVLEPGTAKLIFGTLKNFVGLQKSGKNEAQLRLVLPDKEEVKLSARIVKNKLGAGMAFSMPDWTRDIYKKGLVGLGMDKGAAERIIKLVQSSGTSVLNSGMTGSGRTTTFYALMSEVDIFTTDVTIIEPGPQHELNHVNRIQKTLKSPTEAADTIEMLKREEVDFVGVDEIRKFEILPPFVDFVADGKQFVGTIRSPGVLYTLNGLLKTLDAKRVTENVSCITGQKLIRTLCENCKEEVEPPASLLSRLKIDPANPGRWYKPVGCDRCLGSGYRGQTALFEVLFMDEKVSRFVVSKGFSPKELKKVAMQSGAYRTLYQDGVSKIKQGWTTFNELKRILQAGRKGGK